MVIEKMYISMKCYYELVISLVGRVFGNGFNPRSSHTKDFKNGTWYLLAEHSAL